MSSLEALLALLLILSAAALLVGAVPHLEPEDESSLQEVLDAQGLGRSTGEHESRGYARWWDCAEDNCI